MVFCRRPLEGKRNFIEFKVTMNISVRGKSSLFVGLVDRYKYRPEQLVSTFWKDSPSSFYWDIWNNKLVKIDSNGCQVGVMSGYGCGCQDFGDTTVGLQYDNKEQSLTYYKNGINHGIAFHNVPRGLYPAVDLWFESGHVEILRKSQPSIKEYL